MRIAIDARMYGTAQRGIGRYLMKLIENLEKLSPPRGVATPLGGGQFTIFLRKENFEEYTPKNPNFKKALWDAKWYGWREQLQFRPLNTVNRELKTDAYIYHFPHWNVPLFFNKPFVVTIHDLQLFSSSRVRESTTRGKLVYALKFLGFKIIFRHAVLTARAIIVPSNYVKTQLLAKYPRLKEKTFVIYEAPTIVDSSRSTVHRQQLQTVNRELMTENYILYVGAAYPHKNIERLLKAWNIIREKLPDYKLVLVGREDHFWKKLKQQYVNMLTWEHDNIVWYNEADDNELAALYQNASLLVQPSLEEGFSLTPVEALSCGCPVAVSDIPVHHETLQNAAWYFNPKDANSIAQTIKTALANPKHQPINKYSWRKTAEQTLNLYLTSL